DGDATELAGVPLPAGGTGPSLVVVPIIDGQVSGVWLAAGMGTSIDVRDIEITSDAIYVAGGFLGSIAFGTGTVTAAAKDGFVVRFERQGFEAAPGNAAETYAVQLTGSGDDEVRAVVEHQAQLFTAGIYGTDLVWKLGASSDTIFSVNDLGRAFVLPLNKASGAPAPAAKLGFVADAVDANSLVASGEHVYAAGDFAGGEMSFLTNPGGGEVPNIRGAGTRTLWLVDFSTTAGTNVDQTRSFGSGKHQLKGLGLRNELPLMVATCDGPFTVIDAMGVATTIDDGLTEAQAPSGEDLCLVGLSPSLEVASDGFHRLGGEDPESQVADGVGSHASGALVVTGHYRGDLVFSQQTLSNSDGYDKGFAFRLAP
ncbi:MAG: hypothetical protein KC731_37100, partial [Myxococcales bacterium]|nr:hypothetical protein [Myxococcales bacterium]